MATSIYITTAEAHCGKSLICLGILEYALHRTERVSVFRPIVSTNSSTKRDKNIELLLNHFNLDQNYDESYAFHSKEAEALISRGKTDQLLDRIIAKYKNLESKSDFILIEGTDFVSEGSASFEFAINIQVAKNLGSPVLLIGRGDMNRNTEEILAPLRLAMESFHERDYDVVGVIINRAQSAYQNELLDALKELRGKNLFVSVIPQNELLKSPTVREIIEHLEAEVLYGHNQIDNQVYKYSVAAMQLNNYLGKISENCMVVTPGDRGEILMGTLEAHNSKNYPQVAAIVLTNNLLPDPNIRKLLDGLSRVIPILLVKDNTYETVMKLNGIHSYITKENPRKIEESLQLFEEHVNLSELESITSQLKSRGLTPRMFQYLLTEKARKEKKHIVLPEGTDERILRAAETLVNQGLVNLTLLGDEEEISQQIAKLGLNISPENVTITNPQASSSFDDYVEAFYAMRKEKGINLDMAKDAMKDVSYFGTMMVYQGHADGMVSGAVHTTQHTIRPALQFIKTKPGFSVVSSVFFMCLEDKVLVYGDCAINPNPDARQLAEIASSSAHTAQSFGIEPKVAMLSYSSGKSGKGEDVERVREATEIVQSGNPDFKVEGPIQYDAAVDLEVGLKKIPDSEVAGQASVLIFPDLNTGNNTYKAVQRETGAIAIGPVLQGLNKPVNDLSRGCTVTDIVNTVIITAIQAQGS